MNDTLITSEGLQRLEAELDELRTAGRIAISERIRSAARSESNAVEGAEYQDAREDQAFLERRIVLLEHRIATATVVEPDGRNGAVDVGERVTIRDLDSGDVRDYRLVGTLEAAPSEGRISVASPLGRALLGSRVGETATVDAPKGRLRFEILSIAEGRRRRAAARAGAAVGAGSQPAT